MWSRQRSMRGCCYRKVERSSLFILPEAMLPQQQQRASLESSSTSSSSRAFRLWLSDAEQEALVSSHRPVGAGCKVAVAQAAFPDHFCHHVGEDAGVVKALLVLRGAPVVVDHPAEEGPGGGIDLVDDCARLCVHPAALVVLQRGREGRTGRPSAAERKASQRGLPLWGGERGGDGRGEMSGSKGEQRG